MGDNKSDLLRGTLDLLILKALSLESLHGAPPRTIGEPSTIG